MTYSRRLAGWRETRHQDAVKTDHVGKIWTRGDKCPPITWSNHGWKIGL